jgi:hypothetical protein
MVIRRFVLPILASLPWIPCCLSTAEAGNEAPAGTRKITETPMFAEDVDVRPTTWSSNGFKSAAAMKSSKVSSAAETVESPRRSHLAEASLGQSSKVTQVAAEVPEKVQSKATVHPAILEELESIPSASPRKAAIARLEDQPAQTAQPQYLTELQSLTDGSRPWVRLNDNFAAAAPKQIADAQPAWFRELQSIEQRAGVSPAAPALAEGIIQVSASTPAGTSQPPVSAELSSLFPKLSDLTLTPATAKSNEAEKAAIRARSEVRGSIDVNAWFSTRVDGNSYTGPVHRSSARDTYAFHHQPLYFEQANLERCGKSWGCLTTAVSATHFAASTVMLPWQMAVSPPCSTVRTLRDCKAGCEYPMSALLPECSWTGATAEAAVITGLIFIIP